MTLSDLPNSFSYGLARARGVSERRLRALVADEALERLGHGLFRKADAPPADLDRIGLALRAPEATLCLRSALSMHDLTDDIPSVIHVALPRSKRPPKVQAPVHWHRFHEESFHHGRTSFEVDEGLSLGLYSAERSIIDAFRLRHQEGEDLAYEALRRWLKQPGSTPAELLEMAQWFPRVEGAVLGVLRVLL